MKKRLLIAVGDCVYSRHAVKYAARICSAAEGVTFTLFNLQPLVPHIFDGAAKKDAEVRTEIDRLIHADAEAAQETVDKFKNLMVSEGIPEKCVGAVTEPVGLGVAKDILNRAEQGRYDAIILARKGLTPNRDFFIGTTAAKVIEHALDTPVWVAAGEDTSTNMMAAVDGSENSLRLVDHLIKMVGPHPELRITLFHVSAHLRHYYSPVFERDHPHLHKVLQQEDKVRMDRFYEAALERFKKAGFQKSQVRIKTGRQSCYDVSTAILGEARKELYSTVVVGRRGEREAFFTGRIAMRLIQKLTDQALWVVP